MNKLSITDCPDCDSKNITKLKWRPYDAQVFKCKSCYTTWDKNTRYCNKCKDVVMYCDCYRDYIEKMEG